MYQGLFECSIVPPDVELGQEDKHFAGHWQWQTAGVGYTGEKAQVPERQKVLNTLGKLTGSMAIIQQSQ